MATTVEKEILEIAKDIEADDCDTPGGVEHVGDFRRLIMRWAATIEKENADGSL